VIAELRSALISDIETGLDGAALVYPPWPDRFGVPAVIIAPPLGDYITAGQTTGSYVCRVDALCLVSKSGDSLAALDDLVESVLENTVDWALAGVDSPSTVVVGAAEYLGTLIHLAKQSKI
jgi:hypothetical protein